MDKRPFIALLFVVCAFASAMAQQPAPAKAANPKDQPAISQKGKEDVVRISVTLVQVDAVVTDSSGLQITGLKPEDFEILEDGRRQHITNFSYVSTQPVSATTAITPGGRTKTPPPVAPPVHLRPDQVRRTMALVVDDLGLSAESIAAVRTGLKKLVDEQMQPGDLVAILRTGTGMGALQQFTSDKRQLYAAIERVRWNLMGSGGLSAFAPLESNLIPPTPLESRSESGRDSLDEFRGEVYSAGTLGTLQYVVRGLRDLPGRKSVILFSDGFKVLTASQSPRVLESVRALIDLANRSSVVFYIIDPRGLQWVGLTAADNIGTRRPNQIQQVFPTRSTQMWETQGGPNYLAQETGGLFVRNNNDVGDGIKRVLEDQKGHYLLGYVPEENTFKLDQGRRKFHKIAVRVKKRGLKVRSRTGFFGVPDEESAPTPRTPQGQVLAALMSPFGSADIHLKLTSLFAHDSRSGPFLRSLLHIDARDLTFTDEPDGSHKSVLNVVAVTFGDNGGIVDQEGRTYTVQIAGEDFQRVLDNGFLYTVNVLVKKPGAYQLRAAVRDAASERVGSANQFVDVPDIARKRLALSDIVLSGSELSQPSSQSGRPAPQAPRQAGQQAVTEQDGAASRSDPRASPSVRLFRSGMNLDYGFLIYNAELDSKTNRTRLESQVLLLKDGNRVFASEVSPIDVDPQQDLSHIHASGQISLGNSLGPGEYVLQIIIIDRLAKNKYRSATRWMDFEIVK